MSETPMTPELRAQVSELIGNAKPATPRLLEQIADAIRDRREHEHPRWDDLYCLNLVAFMGERMAPVLRRLLNAETAADTLAYAVAPPAVIGEHSAVNDPWANALDLITPMAEVDALRTKLSDLEERTEQRRIRLAAAEADLLAVRGLLSPAGGARRVPAEVQIHERVAPAVEWLLARIAQLEAAPTAVFRASHGSIVMGLYTTAAEARKHCETELRRDLPTVAIDWIEDEEDGVAELVASVGEDERVTGYVVEALEVASEYDEEADE
ncbi:hypothetical protein [Streptomyces achromogenes]|uniref:hypothetical protein n=1 Tax=Streptomyces achromogenes TaxID=67255 RepID=UPI0036B623B9